MIPHPDGRRNPPERDALALADAGLRYSLALAAIEDAREHLRNAGDDYGIDLGNATALYCDALSHGDSATATGIAAYATAFTRERSRVRTWYDRLRACISPA